jgi:glutaredoxin
MKKVSVTIYTRPGCHLCEEAKAAIYASDCGLEFSLEEINIDDDPALRERYSSDIPVVFINGVKVFKHRVDRREFKRKFRRLARNKRSEYRVGSCDTPSEKLPD